MFFSKKDTTQYGVLFEVGSGSVAGAIVSSGPHAENPIILYATREFLPLKQTTHNEDISKRLLSAFLTIAIDVEGKLTEHIPKTAPISTVCVNFTAPWSYTRGNTHIYENEENIQITAKLLDKIKKTTNEKLQVEASKVDILIDSNFTLINRTIIGHTANGYPINNPIGQTVKTLTTTETISTVTNTVFIPVQDIMKKLFPRSKVEFSTSPLLQQHILHSQMKTPPTFATIHLTHEALEMTLYRENKIITAYTTSIGINTIARNIASASKLPHEQIFSFLTAEDNVSYQETVLSKIQKAFEAKVLHPLADFFAQAKSSELLPKDFYLITTLIPSPAIINIITEALKKSANNRFVLHNLYTPIVHNAKRANLGSNDLGICTLAYFFHNNCINN